MNDFKGRHFRGEVILWAVRWYCRYGISYQDLETILAEQVVSVDHATIYHCVQRYASEMEKRPELVLETTGFHAQLADGRDLYQGEGSVDVSVSDGRHRWRYDLFLLVTNQERQNCPTLLDKMVNGLKEWGKPETINTDKPPTYGIAIVQLKKDGKLKQLIKPVHDFKTLRKAYATIKGFEVMRAWKKGQTRPWRQEKGIMGDVRLIERQFGIYTF